MTDVHALVVTVPADGHINCLLRLAQALASHGFLITFAYPARAHALQQRRNGLRIHHAIRVEVIPDGLPTDEDLLPTLQQLLASVPIMQEAVQLLIQKLSAGPVPISCILSDTFASWTQDVADEVGLPRVDCWTSTATVYSMGLHLPELISRGYLPVEDAQNFWRVEATLVDSIPGLPAFPVTELPQEFLVEDLFDAQFQFMISAFARVKSAHAVLVHSSYELESSAFDALQAAQIPVYSVGPLYGAAIVSTLSANDKECLLWLERQLVASVVYVAFGTRSTHSAQETHELALGLEAAGYPFIWVIRANSIKGKLSDNLPDGFLARTRGRGLIMSWAPQPEVLQHPSVGAFLTHCGWNSTLESLWAGKPMVVCPKAGEQRSNARHVVEEWKAGIELERKDDWSFTKEAVEESVNAIMRSSEVREQAMELKELLRGSVGEGRTSYRNLVNFVHSMKIFVGKDLSP